MANEVRVRSNFLGGAVEDNPLASAATTLTSAALAVAPAIGTTQHLPITLDPDGIDGVPEIAWITAHTAGANTATLLRGQEGTAARLCYQDTPWVHGPTVRDLTTYSSARGQQLGSLVAQDPTTILVTNLNQNLFTGFYNGNAMTGAPDAQWWLVHVLAHNNENGGNTAYVRQIAYRMTGGGVLATANEVYARACVGGDPTVAGSWTPWVLLSEGGDIAWIAPTLTNSWVNYAGYSPAGYRKDAAGYVHVRGLVANGTAAVAIFTLPAGYRPGNQCIFTSIANNNLARIDVMTSGVVQVAAYGAGGSNAYVSLDNVIFLAEA